MGYLPIGVERIDTPPGPFLTRNNNGSHSVVVLTEVIVTCGGEDGRDRAVRLARAFNEVWDQLVGKNFIAKNPDCKVEGFEIGRSP